MSQHYRYFSLHMDFVVPRGQMVALLDKNGKFSVFNSANAALRHYSHVPAGSTYFSNCLFTIEEVTTRPYFSMVDSIRDHYSTCLHMEELCFTPDEYGIVGYRVRVCEINKKLIYPLLKNPKY